MVMIKMKLYHMHVSHKASLAHNVSFWAQKLTHYFSFWGQKLTKCVTFWAKKLLKWVSIVYGPRN